MAEYTLVRIDQLPPGTITESSLIMFGIGELIYTCLASELIDLIPSLDPNVRPRLVDLEVTVLEADLNTFLSTINITIASGEVVYIRFGVIRSNGFIGRDTYAIPLSTGVYNPLGATLPFADLILMNQENFNTQGDANTITYSFVNIGEINSSDPAIDFSDNLKEYIVILNNFPYLFIGLNGFYGVGGLTMVDGDLQALVNPAGVNTVSGVLVNNADPSNPIVNGMIVQQVGSSEIPQVKKIVFGSSTVANNGAGQVTVTPTGGGGGGAVDSVNNQTGVVVLDTDDIADTPTNRYTSDAELAKTNSILSTGWEIGGAGTIAGANSINIAPMLGYIVDDTVSPPIVTRISTPAINGVVITNLLTEDSTDIAINALGQVVQQSFFTREQLRTHILLMGIDHSGGAMQRIFPLLIPVFGVGTSVRDLAIGVGALNMQGNVFTPAGVNLTINKSVGQAFSYGGNANVNKNDPHFITNADIPTVTFSYIFRDGLGGTTVVIPTTTINPLNYDDGTGVLATIPVNDFGIHQFLMFPNSNKVFVQYGGVTFNTMNQAIAGLSTTTFPALPGFNTTMRRGVAIVKRGTTNLSISADARFFAADKFGSIAGAVGGGADLGFTPENVANKATTLASPDNTKYPTTLAVDTAIKTATFTIELIDELIVDFYAPANLRINTTTNIVALPTVILKVNDVAYTLTNLITQGDKITVEVNITSVVNLNVKYE